MSDLNPNAPRMPKVEVQQAAETPENAYPLSPLQQGMLFHWLIDRHSGTDVEQIIADLDEVVDPAVLHDGWQRTVDQIATLRTAFRWKGLPAPVQRIEATAVVPFAFEDLRGLAESARAERFEEFLRLDRRDGFDLTHAPAMRVSLFQFEPARFRMVWTFHHILIDRRTFEPILKSVFGDANGAPVVVEANRPYREYIDWVTQQSPDALRKFWRGKLKDLTAPTPIPAHRAVDDDRQQFGEVTTLLSKEFTTRLQDLIAREDLSLGTLLISAWALLLSRYSGEKDVVLGVNKSTRRGTIANADAMIGLLTATIPVRIAVDPDATTIDWLRRVRSEWVSLRGFEHLPLVDIRQASGLPPSSPLFDSLVVYENSRFGTRLGAQGGRWAHRQFSIREQTGFPLTLHGYGDKRLLLKLEFDPRRFNEDAIRQILDHVTTMLEAWSESTDGLLGATPMLTAAERKLILDDWNDTAAVYPGNVSLAALVEAQVARMPNGPAVTFEERTMTYQELNTRANRLAHELRRRGVGPDVLVGVMLERSAEMMVALLAVIKAGSAYVPLDPIFPRERLDYVFKDSRLGILITQRSLRRSLPEFAGAVLEMDAPTWEDNESTNPDVTVSPENLAVVIYTSGSTGRPKGVLITRRALINVLWCIRRWLGVSASDRLLSVTTISFDIAGADVWMPWIVGAHVVIATRSAAADGMQLRELIARHDITFLQATPVTWRQLLEVNWQGKSNLQAVCTGEAMPPEVAAGLVPRVGRLWNLYGPTETTIWSTGMRVTSGNAVVAIGRPVANTQCYILDESGQPVPVGGTGELFIAGDGLARSYLNLPDLDATKFIPNPFSQQPAARMYRTGDRARYLPDGTIECLGRTDHQVKIRGFRIELGEIEAVLQQHAAVRQTVVVARDHAMGEKRLVAYVVPESAPIDAAALRAHMRQGLPDYMIPAAIVSLDRLPLTVNGKIDRRALPEPDESVGATRVEVITARTHVERQLSVIFEEIFGLSTVGVHDNFFDLGGHSILAVRMMSRIASVFGKQLPLNAIFESPTIELLAKHVEDASATLGRHSLVSLQVAGSYPPVFWVPGGAALGLFRLRRVLAALGPEQPVYGLGSNYPRTLTDVETVEERARKYVELVRRVQPHGPYSFVGFCAGGLVVYEMAQQLIAVGEKVAFVGLINADFPNHPTGAPSFC